MTSRIISYTSSLAAYFRYGLMGLLCSLILSGTEFGIHRAIAEVSDAEDVGDQAEIHQSTVEVDQSALVDLFDGEVFGVSYSGYREGQHPDQGEGAVDPSREEILEDLDILVDYGFRLIRLYDAGSFSQKVLALIREKELPIRVLLGAWLKAEVSNHEGCPWLTEPIPEEVLATNVDRNKEELERAIRLAREYADIVVAVNVGNEALVDWNDHMVTLDSVISYVRRVKAAIDQPVTVADNFLWWAEHGAPLAAELDFIGVHSYPMLDDGGKPIDEALSFTIENVAKVRAAIPNRPIAILEAGWATTSGYLPEQASEENQLRYFRELRQWAHQVDLPVFFFEAFDEPWKGNAADHLETEKHWGLFRVDRAPKRAIGGWPISLLDSDSVVWALNVGGDKHLGSDGIHFERDASVVGGRPGQVSGVVAAQDSLVFETYRRGDLRIHKDLPNGTYDLTFLFVEPEGLGVDKRLFDVIVQGEVVIESLDLRRARWGQLGNEPVAVARKVTGIEISNGRLEVELAGTVGAPVLSGLIVRSRTPDRNHWKLVWADEFGYEGPVDASRWTAEVWNAGKVNDELQAYTDREKNIRVTDGKLIIEAHREAYNGADYTSARIHSRGKGDMLYGRVDVRARLPAGQGSWAALWMLPSDMLRYATKCRDEEDLQGKVGCDAWPNSGEIDIMEHVGYDMNRVHGSAHNRVQYGGDSWSGSIEAKGLDEEFHIYSLVWTPEILQVYLDGNPFFTYFNARDGWETWPYDHPYHLIMNLAIGGTWGGAGGPVDDSIFPARMMVDYVRVFESVGATVTEISQQGRNMNGS